MNKRFKNILICFLCLPAVILFGGCSGGSNTGTEADSTPTASPATAGEYRKITAEEAKQMMDEGDVVVADVRTESEFLEKRIAGAVLIPNETIGDTMPEQLPDIDAVILIYCRSGNRSRQAAEKLIAMGYTNIYDFGGIIDWPYDTVSG